VQQLGQRWFITAYIVVYIQGLYTVDNGAGVQGTVAVLELAGNQGRRQAPQVYSSIFGPCLNCRLVSSFSARF
jgi:hypothetical protein